MTKEMVFEALMQADYRDISPLASLLRQSVPHTVIKKPAQELVMFRVEENVEKLDFNVGEVLAVSAEVRVRDVIGYSMVMGTNRDMALDCALLMGVYEAGLPQKPEVEKLAEGLLQKREVGLREEQGIVDSTRVSFELMGGQDPNVSHNKPREDNGE
jgi:phosphonate C-P lyase system protein PhnG